MSKKRDQTNWSKEYYQNNKDKILNQEKQKYHKLSPDEKQRRLDLAKARRLKKKEENKLNGVIGKDKYAKARSLGYRSMFEVTIADAAESAGMKLTYEPHTIPYTIKGNYVPDFQLPNGILIEAKGYLDAGTCRKMLSVKASNPELDIRFVFQKANGKRNKRAKLQNWQWAEKHGFLWSEGTIPLTWWKEQPLEVQS